MSESEKKQKRITFRVTPSLAEALAKAARREKREQSEIIRDALESRVDKKNQ